MLLDVKRERSWAWLLIGGTGSVLATFERQLTHLVGQSYSCLAYFVSGLALGWAWYRLSPRTLAARLFGVTVLFSLAIVATTAFTRPGGEFVLIDDPSSPVVLLPVGLLAGLVLTEAGRPGGESRRQRDTALTSRETLRDLR